jgi:hypothetical protein
VATGYWGLEARLFELLRPARKLAVIQILIGVGLFALLPTTACGALKHPPGRASSQTTTNNAQARTK